jgi:LysR family transcriptional regulator, glycine cleavage system transcriptional activator
VSRRNTNELDSRQWSRTVPSLQALRCFDAAAREESFTRAALMLNVTHGAVSRAIRLLEDELGVNLFERRNRRVFLTAEGHKLSEAVRQGFDLITTACSELRGHSERPSLLLACEPTLMMRWLIPNLPSIQSLLPDLDLRLVAASGPVLGNGIDMAIRRNDVSWPEETHSQLLFAERVGPVCRPDLVCHFFSDEKGSLHLSDSATRLHTNTRPEAWSTWNTLTGQPSTGRLSKSFEHFYFSLQAAAAGVGVAIGPWQLVRTEVENGILAAPLGFVEDGSGYYLLSTEPFAESKVRSSIRDWLGSISR